MRICLIILLIGFSRLHAQTTVANAHSHNDYEQQRPFWEAYEHGFGSIEVDIFSVANEPELLVAHTRAELKSNRRRLDSLYLLPLVSCLQKNGGTIYPDKNKTLQVLVDIKSAAVPTLQKFIETVRRYPQLTQCKQLRFVISGNRPQPDSFSRYPDFILFDGELDKTYSQPALDKIAMMSGNLKSYASWNGKDSLAGANRQALLDQISKAHQLNKAIRFWNAPDEENAWRALIMLGADYINTDKIAALASFLNLR